MSDLYKTEPKDHQVEALRKARLQTNFAYFMKMGTGKSKVMIDEAAELWRRGEITAVIVITLNGLQQNWVLRELPAHCPVPWSGAWMRGNWKKAEQDAWAKTRTAQDCLKFFTLNVEQVSRSKTSFDIVLEILRDEKVYFVADESQFMKSPTSNISKRMHNLREWACYRRLSTGTAAPQYPLDLWSQFKFLDERILGHRLFTTFKKQFAKLQNIPTRSGRLKKSQKQKLLEEGNSAAAAKIKFIPGRDYYEKILDFRNLEKLKATIEPYVFSCQLDLDVDLTYSEMYVELTAEQRRIYNELKQHCVASYEGCPPGEDPLTHMIENADIIPQNSLTRMLRMQQVTTGHVKDDYGVIKKIESHRVDALVNLLESLGDSSALIWCNFTEDIFDVAAALGDECRTYYGETDDEERQQIVDDFQARKFKYFVGTPSAGGVGLTLTAANYVIFFSLGFNAMTYAQAIARAYRIGQLEHVHVIHMLGIDTIDLRILSALQMKVEMQELLIYGEPGSVAD